MLPKDSAILLSYINTMLRDNYPSLTELCKSLGESEDEIKTSLAKIDYYYDEKGNRFI